MARVAIEDPRVRAMGAVNLVRFESGRARGFNTDYSGFVAAYRAKFGAGPPGVVCQVGAGGAGRAVGFALADLGAEAIRVVDVDRVRARSLAGALRSAYPGLDATPARMDEAVRGALGLVNCTPVGMAGHHGTPIPRSLMRGAAWAFDAVYTPVRTRFLADAKAAGIDTLTGYELYFHQGADGFEIFSRSPVDRSQLREALGGPDPLSAS